MCIQDVIASTLLSMVGTKRGPSFRSEFSGVMRKILLKHKGNRCAGSVPGIKCRKQGTELNAHLRAFDHIVPARVGGLPTYDNGQILCLDCHSHKSLLENKIFPRKNSIRKYNPKTARRWITRILKME
jgi:5-methylcytosine-specific restriction endonuclease McrA